jgi:cold shock CspA family protein
MRLKGTIIEWRDDRGFGFIEPARGGKKVFCHVKAFAIRVRRPQPGDAVTSVAKKDAQGRVQAADVRPNGLEQAAYNSNVEEGFGVRCVAVLRAMGRAV